MNSFFRKFILCALATFAGLFPSGPAFAETPTLPPPEMPPAAHQHQHPAVANQPDLTENLGGHIPLDLHFRDEDGREVVLQDLIDRPTVIAPVYFHCPDVCSYLQGALANTLPDVALRPGKDYRVISVSFDDSEGPELARHAKRGYYSQMKNVFPPDAWRFLTGDTDQIRRLTDSLGFHFQRQGNDFLHPVAIAVVTKDGEIVRYLYGTRFLPMDLNLALMEAAEGRIGTSIKRVLQFCFSYDPAGRRYTFNLLRVSATVVLLTAGSFLAFLLLYGRKKRKHGRKS